MKDQKLYIEISQILYNESPCLEDMTNVSMYLGNGSVDACYWIGEKKIRGNGFLPSSDSNYRLGILFQDLRVYFSANGLGVWNVVHFRLMPHGKSFKVDFDNCLELDTGKVPLWKYRKKYKEKGDEKGDRFI